MSFLVYDSVILRLIERLTQFDTYEPLVAYAIDTTARRWCHRHAPPGSHVADPQQECLPRCVVCDRVLRGAMNDCAAKRVITIHNQTDIDLRPATIYLIVSALEKAVSWQEGVWLRAAAAVGERLLGLLSKRYDHGSVIGQ